MAHHPYSADETINMTMTNIVGGGGSWWRRRNGDGDGGIGSRTKRMLCRSNVVCGWKYVTIRAYEW